MADSNDTAAPAAPRFTCKLVTPEAKRLVLAYDRLPDDLRAQVLHELELLSFNYKPREGETCQ
jgi:hypothetical protein